MLFIYLSLESDSELVKMRTAIVVLSLLLSCCSNSEGKFVPEKQAELNKNLLSVCDWKNDEVDLEKLQGLITAGADVNTADSIGGTCLCNTAYKGRYEATQILINNNATVNMKGNQGWTALNIASEHGHNDIVRLLLENGADPDIKNDYGDCSLSSASSNGNKEIEKLITSYSPCCK